MDLSHLIKITKTEKKRVGRGIGSGKGKTSGRGTKGQKARENVSLGFIGGTLPFYKKIPYRRGLGNPKRSPKMVPLAVNKLSVFPPKSEVTLESLIDHKLVNASKAGKYGVKIVGGGSIDVPLTIHLPITSAALKEVEKSGGRVVNV